MNGIVGAKAIGKSPLESAIKLGKQAIKSALFRPVKNKVRIKIAFIIGPVIAC